MNREKIIIQTSIIGIATNVLLAVFKAIVGLASHSIAVVLDAVNNLSDALSSLITIVGTKLAGKAPNKKHPLGYGRIEYLTAMIVSGIVFYAGITSLTESVKKIIHPEMPDYSKVSLLIIGSSVVVKIILGRYVTAQGKKTDSSSLIASGSDASFDAILSASVLASAVIFMLTSLSLEAYVGIVISGFIIKSGIEMMIDTLNDILGKRTDTELAKQIKKVVCSDKDVHGAYDLFITNYGPGKDYASIHVEINDTMTANEIDAMERRVQEKVYSECGIILTGIGLYSINTENDAAAKMRKTVYKTVLEMEEVLQLHGFYADTEKKHITFDAVISFDADRDKVLQDICKKVKSLYPDYEIAVQPDIDITE